MKFYETNWFLWLTLILCAPIGIFVLWKFHAEETTRLKMIMSIIFLALFIGVIALGVHFVKGDDHGAQDQKPAKETTEEDTGDEMEEEIGSLAFVFSPNNVTVVGNEAKNVIVSNVDEFLSAIAPDTIVAAVAQNTRLKTKLEAFPLSMNSLKFTRMSIFGIPKIPIT